MLRESEGNSSVSVNPTLVRRGPRRYGPAGRIEVARVYVIGMGSNLGQRERYLVRGVDAIATMTAATLTSTRQDRPSACTPAVRVEALSRVYESAAIGPPQPAYLNAALRIRADVEPELLLDRLLHIEASLGRVRDVRWGPRVLDLDILWATTPFACERLTIPHVELLARPFALAPLLDVAPELAPAYAEALDALGGPPRVCGRLCREQTVGPCEYAAAAL